MANERVNVSADRALCTRVIGEYLEMPGLKVTIPQACRLWNIDQPQCAHLFDTLLASGFLQKSGECYVRRDVGRHAA